MDYTPPPRSAWVKVALGVLGVSGVLRLLSYPVIVSDYTYFIKPWFETLRTHGLAAFTQPFADYAPLYLYLLNLLTFIPVSSLYSAKTLSLLFDIAIAGVGYLLLAHTSVWAARKDILLFAAVILFALPTVMINSSLWGQSDALYTTGVLAALFFILAEMPLVASIAFGVALSFKLQAIFFLPVFLGYLLRKRETWPYILVPPAIFVLTVLPAVIAGGSLLYWLFIYAHQSGEYPYLSVSAQSIFAYLQPLSLSAQATSVAFWSGLAASAAFALFALRLVQKAPVLSTRLLVTVSLACVTVLPYVLPRMHERYFYAADVLSTLYAFYRPSRWWLPVLVVGSSLLSYMPFLSGQVSFLSWAHVDLRIPATLMLIAVGVMLYEMWLLRRNREQVVVA